MFGWWSLFIALTSLRKSTWSDGIRNLIVFTATGWLRYMPGDGLLSELLSAIQPQQPTAQHFAKGAFTQRHAAHVTILVLHLVELDLAWVYLP